MGYARLTFATTVTTAQAMYDVVRLLNGNITSAANLTYATVNSSEVVNTLGENWTVDYGDVADTTTAYVVSSPCVPSGITHYARLQMYNNATWDASAALSTANVGISVNTIESATSATSVLNPTVYKTNNSGLMGGGWFAIKPTQMVLSWSQHHILFYGPNAKETETGFIGTFEYVETPLNTMVNGPPVVQFQLFYNDSGWITVTAPFSTTPDYRGSGVLQGLQVHNPSTNTTTSVTDFSPSPLNTFDFHDGTPQNADPVPTINSSGTYVYPLIPIYWSRPAVGWPQYNISELCKIYRMGKNATEVESVFTVDGDSYAYLPLASSYGSTTQTSAIAVLKK